MKQGIHPQYGKTTIRCACGNVIETKGTVQGTVQVEICSACHPFFTGKQKLIDTAGRIEKFNKKFGDNVVGTQKKKKVAPTPAPKPEKKVEKLGGIKDKKEAPKASAKS